MLAAREFDVGSIPAVMLARQPDLLRKELEIPNYLLIVIGIALGYPDMESPHNAFYSGRRPVSEVVRLRGF
jgi:nitroreductase